MAETIKELAECCICTDFFTDPRIIPCLHTFCLKCITKASEIAQLRSGDSMQCPFCRTPFIIPKEGMIGLKKNFFMERVVEMAELAIPSNTMMYCEICMEDWDENAADTPEAKHYCIQCRKNICGRCCQDHNKYKTLKSHQLVPLGNPLKKELLTKFAQQFCNEHDAEEAKLFCLDCNEPICMNCLAVKHKLHHCSTTETEGDKICEEIKGDVKLIKDLSHEASGKINMLIQSQMDFQGQLENTEKAVVRRSNEMKELIDDCCQSLLNELALIKRQKSKQLETAKEEIERYKASLDSFVSYSTELICNGSSAEMCRSATDLRRRSEDLRKSKANHVEQKISSVEVFFEVSHVCDFPKDQNLVGSITVKAEGNEDAKTKSTDQDHFAKYQKRPELMKSVTIAYGIWGLALLNNKLFIVSIEASEVLLIYEPVTLKLLQRITVRGLHLPRDIVSCQSINAIFVASDISIFCLDPDGKILKRWTLPTEPHNLSATSLGTLLVTCNAKILEYNLEGELLRDINLQREKFDWTWYSVLANSGNFHVNRSRMSSKSCRLLTVNAKGKLLSSYGSVAGSSENSLRGPVCFTVDRDGFVFVADSWNRQILLLSPTMAQTKRLITYKYRAVEPYGITLNESTGVLYVGTNRGDIHIFKLFEFSTF